MTPLLGPVIIYTPPGQRDTFSVESFEKFFQRKAVIGWDGHTPLREDEMAVVGFMPPLDIPGPAVNVLSLDVAVALVATAGPRRTPAAALATDELDV